MGVCVPCVHCDRFRLNCQAGQAYASGTGEGRLRRPEYGLGEPFQAGPGRGPFWALPAGSAGLLTLCPGSNCQKPRPEGQGP